MRCRLDQRQGGEGELTTENVAHRRTVLMNGNNGGIEELSQEEYEHIITQQASNGGKDGAK